MNPGEDRGPMLRQGFAGQAMEKKARFNWWGKPHPAELNRRKKLHKKKIDLHSFHDVWPLK